MVFHKSWGILGCPSYRESISFNFPLYEEKSDIDTTYPNCNVFLNGALTAAPIEIWGVSVRGILYVKDLKLAIEKTTCAYIYNYSAITFNLTLADISSPKSTIAE